MSVVNPLIPIYFYSVDSCGYTVILI